jgi:arsenate reductase-like glutaredoxin family protein
MIQPRTNRTMAITVEKGLYVQRSSTTRKAAVYLATNGVPMHVAVRVLTTPYRRNMQNLINAKPSWNEIIMSAGPTYGDQIDFRAR